MPYRGRACFSVRSVVLDPDASPSARRWDRGAARRARVSVAANYATMPDAKLFATMACHLHLSISNCALDAGLTIGTYEDTFVLLHPLGASFRVSSCDGPAPVLLRSAAVADVSVSGASLQF